MEILVNRIWQAPDAAATPTSPAYPATITGIISVDGTQQCFSLEHESVMIPAATYPVKMAWSPECQRNTPHLDVPGRTDIMLHRLNFAAQSKGCIGCGEKRLSNYEIADCEPATDNLEAMLNNAEQNGETNTVQVIDIGQPAPAA